MKKIIILILPIILITSTLPVTTAQNPGNQVFDETITLAVEDNYNYYSYQNMTDLIHRLKENNSDIMSVTSIGKTYQGRDIWMVKISDNVSKEEDEPGVLLMGAHHGNEKPSFETLIYFIKHLIDNYRKENTDNDNDGFVNEDPIDGFDNDQDGLIDEDPSEDRVREVVNSTQIFLIPMVNPDGVEANTRKNCAPNYGIFGFRKKITSYGVDLNRNYDCRWYRKFFYPRLYYRPLNFIGFILDVGSGYGGVKPFSENETKAVKHFVETHNISISISYHCYGEWMFTPQVYTSKDQQLFKSIGENISDINKYSLIPVSRPRKAFLIRTIGLSEDWLYSEHNILAFLIELGTSFAPTNISHVINLCQMHTGVNLYVCERALVLQTEK